MKLRRYKKRLKRNTQTVTFFPIGLAPEDDVFSRTDLQNSSMLTRFAENLQSAGTAQDIQRAKNMYLETLAPGTVRNVRWSCLHNQLAHYYIRIQQLTFLFWSI